MTSIPPGAPSRRYAIIPTHNRHEMLRTLVTEIAAQVDCVLIVDNASDPPVEALKIIHEVSDGRPRGSVYVMRDDQQPPNLSRLWQLGLFWVAKRERDAAFDTWDVAILNDDVVMKPGWFAPVAAAMREAGAAAACSVPVRAAKLETSGHARHLYGPAFIVRGECAVPDGPLWPDERLQWWGGDTLMDIRAQVNGGTLVVPGPYIENVHANESTVGALAEQAGRDRETFKEIVGRYGW